MNLSGVKNIFLLIGCSILCLQLHAQKVQYSRQRVQLPYYDGMQLVTNISGYHHLVFFTINQQPSLYIFDEQLQLKAKKHLPFILRQTSDISILRFSDFFYLYLHQPGSTSHQLWKVSPTGSAIDLSASFQQLIDSSVGNHSATLQLVNQRDQLFVICNTYYDAVEKIGSTVLQPDPTFKIHTSRKIYYPFKRQAEQVKQVMLVNNEMYILKTSNDTSGNALHLVKANFTSGRLLIHTFNSGSAPFTTPGFKFNPADSGIIIHSMINNAIFINKLDSLLNQQEPAAFQKNLFGKYVSANFLLVGDQWPQWITMQIRPFRIPYNSKRNNTWQYDNNSAGWSLQQTEEYANFDDFLKDAPAIRFTRVDEHLRIVKDSLVENNKTRYTLFPGPFAQAVIHNKNVLFLNQLFFDRNYGMVMLGANQQNQLAATDIRVFEKYRYLLPHLQAVNNEYAILPFIYKKEIGLAKILVEK